MKRILSVSRYHRHVIPFDMQPGNQMCRAEHVENKHSEYLCNESDAFWLDVGELCVCVCFSLFCKLSEQNGMENPER